MNNIKPVAEDPEGAIFPSLDRRMEVREPASGEVRFLDVLTAKCIATGWMVDRSISGFRARYAGRPFGTGDVIGFEHPYCAGIARVAWTRISTEGTESGFVIAQETAPDAVL